MQKLKIQIKKGFVIVHYMMTRFCVLRSAIHLLIYLNLYYPYSFCFCTQHACTIIVVLTTSCWVWLWRIRKRFDQIPNTRSIFCLARLNLVLKTIFSWEIFHLFCYHMFSIWKSIIGTITYVVAYYFGFCKLESFSNTNIRLNDLECYHQKLGHCSLRRWIKTCNMRLPRPAAQC